MSLISIGKKESLSILRGSEIEIGNTNEGQGKFWYRAVLEESLMKSKRKKLSVRHLKPLVYEDYTPPMVTTTLYDLIRPVPPKDLFGDVKFEEGDVIDAVIEGGWWYGWVIRVLGNQRYLVFVESEVDVIEVDRKELRKHLVWKDDEWFRCEKRELIESEFSAGKDIEVRTEVEVYGDVWAPAIAIKEDEEGMLIVKYKSLKGEDGECVKKSVPYSEVRPIPLPVGLRKFSLMEKVEAQINSGWCPGLVTKVLWGNRYDVRLGKTSGYQSFDRSQLRPAVEWKNGAWRHEEEVSNIEESVHAAEDTTASTRIRVTIKPSHTGINLRTTRSSSAAMQNTLSALSNRGVVEARKVSVNERGTQLYGTTAELVGTLTNKNTPVRRQPEIAAPKESRAAVVLGVTATPLAKSATKTLEKISPKKELQTMSNQKGSKNDSLGEKAPEEMKTRENAHKRKRAQPKKFVSTEPKKKTVGARNGPKAATIEINNMADDDTPLASWIRHAGNSSSGQSVSPTPDPMLNTVVEKYIDVVATPPGKDMTMVLPFAKKSPLWNIIESMPVFKAVPQHPHFSPLLESEEEFREGNAIGEMVKFTGMLEKVANIQVDDPISLIKRYDECFVSLEKYGFNVTAPRSRIAKLLSIKESQTWAMEELKAAERMITEKDNKRRKCEADIAELLRQEALLKEEKVTLDKEIARIQTQAAVLDQKVQNVEQEIQAVVAAPW